MIHAALARVTVVVPVGPGDHVSARLRTQLAALPPGAQVHLVLADVAAADGIEATPPSAAGPTWQFVVAPPGRASQQNAGAATARRDWLWFVHADTVMAPATLPALARFIQAGEASLGYFELRFLDDGPGLMRVNELGAWLRSHVLGLPFGDQGLVLPRAVFEQLAGFDPALSRGEDHDLVWRARRAGVGVTAIGAPLYTSARRYADRGWWATTAATLRDTATQARRFSRVVPRQ